MNPSNQSVCLYVYPSCRYMATARLSVSFLSVLGNGSVNCIPHFGTRHPLDKHVPEATNTRKSKGIAGRVIFCAVRVLLKESLCVCVSVCVSPYRC
jgi:hypothetical protein